MAKKDEGPEKASRENVRTFMVALIGAGAVSEIPESGADQNALSQDIRQMAEKLTNQLRKFD